jgi:hypothetical protein
MLELFKRAVPLLDTASRDRWAIALEADELEDVYQHRAVEWVRARIAVAHKHERARLYKLHDELVRRMAPGPAAFRH